jgi:hypothetical protein
LKQDGSGIKLQPVVLTAIKAASKDNFLIVEPPENINLYNRQGLYPAEQLYATMFGCANETCVKFSTLMMPKIITRPEKVVEFDCQQVR